MNEVHETEQQDQPQNTAFLGLHWGEKGIEVGVFARPGDSVHILTSLMWPSVKEQEGRSPNIAAPPEGGDRISGAAALPLLMKMEMKSGAKGFVSIEADETHPVACLYLNVPVVPADATLGVRAPVSGMRSIREEVNALGVRLVAAYISDADYQFMDGACRRIMMNCALNDCRSLFLPLPQEGEGVEGGVRRSLEKKGD